MARPLTVSGIQKILTNPFYTGRTFGNENNYVRSVSHEALISDELFNKVQAQLKNKNVSLHYMEKIKLPFRGLIRCADCRRVYTPYLQKGIQYFGARCAAGCANPEKSFNVLFLEQEAAKFINGMTFTENERIQLDASTTSEISRFEAKRLNRIRVAGYWRDREPLICDSARGG